MPAGFLLDTMLLRTQQNSCAKLAKRAKLVGAPFFVSTPTLAELLRAERVRWESRGSRRPFDAELIIQMLKDAGLELLHFEKQDAVALERWTADQWDGDRGYQAWKAKQAAQRVAYLFRAEHTPSPSDQDWGRLLERVKLACDDHIDHNRHVSSTTDWLLIGMAQARDLWLVTNESGAEFTSMETIQLSQAEAILKKLEG